MYLQIGKNEKQHKNKSKNIYFLQMSLNVQEQQKTKKANKKGVPKNEKPKTQKTTNTCAI
jgi:hypothetical protein